MTSSAGLQTGFRRRGRQMPRQTWEASCCGVQVGLTQQEPPRVPRKGICTRAVKDGFGPGCRHSNAHFSSSTVI